ncbi:polymorphic toxin type 34 domain-containing protein [Nocardia sp. NPDC050412]|uniref:polymorphic toxin type 34 domain-containing protein n=1 Tax=Nocardia sp. NPDC050412 TaxID=3364320 RepID=UPI003797002C
MAINVDPQTYYDAAAKCGTINSEILTALSTLWNSLQDSGQMAGSYDKAAKWAAEYDDNATDLLSTCASMSNALANFSNILNTAGNNWVYSNWKANPDPSKGAAPTPPFHVPQGVVFQNDITPAPSAFGGTAKGLDTSVPGLLDQIGYTVPNGDTDRVKSAGEAWKKFAESSAIKNAQADIKAIIAAIHSAKTEAPDIADVEAHLTTLANGAAAIASVSMSLSGAVGDHHTNLVAFRSDLDSHVNSLMKELFWIAVGTVAAVALTEILTAGLATLGPAEAEAAAGTAAGTAAVATTATRIRNLWNICRLFQTLEVGVGIAAAVNSVHPLNIQTSLDEIASLTAVSVAGVFVAEMAKGGKQRVADTGIENEMRALIESGAASGACEALAKLWDEAENDAKRRQRIKKTQKQHECRQSSGGGGR